jgi:hypothetical protein
MGPKEVLSVYTVKLIMDATLQRVEENRSLSFEGRCNHIILAAETHTFWGTKRSIVEGLKLDQLV